MSRKAMRAWPLFLHCLRDRREISNLKRSTSALTVQPALTITKPSSNGIRYLTRA